MAPALHVGDLIPYLTPLNVTVLSIGTVSYPFAHRCLWIRINLNLLVCLLRCRPLRLQHLPPPTFQIPWPETVRMRSGQLLFHLPHYLYHTDEKSYRYSILAIGSAEITLVPLNVFTTNTVLSSALVQISSLIPPRPPGKISMAMLVDASSS